MNNVSVLVTQNRTKPTPNRSPLQRIFHIDRQTMMHNEAVAVEMNNSSEDCQEGIASFRERRDPVWKGY